jgi:uridine monophosphate synthetase
MICDLIKTNCIKTGKFKLKNGEYSKYYFDMKNLISYPTLLSRIGDELYKLIENCDVICGVPVGGIPVSSYISTRYNIPMIICRNSIKKYGTEKCIEGTYKKSDNCIIIDDVITSGSSINNVINLLDGKINIIGVIVIIDRQQNHICKFPVKSLYTKTDIVKYRMNNIIKNKKSRLCFSADLDCPDKILNILKDIGKYIIICKIHYDTLNIEECSDFKEKIIELSNDHNFLLMEDRKFSDISYIVEKQYRQFRNWIDLVTVSANVVDDTVKKLSGVLLVANMSNNTYDYTDNAIKLASNNPKHVIGFITQKRIELDGFINMTPGVKLNNEKTEDQNYNSVSDIDTDIIIVGRGIYNFDNYIEMAQKYIL